MPSEPPREIEGFEWIEPLGAGTGGEVWRVRLADGREAALKHLDAMAVNRRLLAEAAERLGSGEAHRGVAVPLEAELETKPYYLVHALQGRPGATGWESVTLRHALAEKWPREFCWIFLHRLAEALAWMHRREVAHCNLTPGNILLDGLEGIEGLDGPDSDVPWPVLVDWAQGWVGGVDNLEPSDALLYAPPEQLLCPGLVDEGGGPRWDVYAFGVVAWRVLHGHFPRLDEDFRKAEQIFQQEDGDHATVRPEALATELKTMPDPEPGVDPEVSAEQAALRALLRRCLSLDAEDRPSDMCSVLGQLETIERNRDLRLAGVAVSRREHRLRSQRRGLTILSLLLLLLLAGATTWAVLNRRALAEAQRNRAEAQLAHEDKLARREAAAASQRERLAAELEAEQVRRREAQRRERVASTSLAEEQRIGNALVETVGLREPPGRAGFREHPVLLARLEEHLMEFQEELAGSELLRPELARTRENLAMLAAARDDPEGEEHFLRLALSDWQAVARKLPDDAGTREALARVQLALAGHELRQGNLEAATDLGEAGTRLAGELAAEPQADGEAVLRHAGGLALLGEIQRQQGEAEAALERFAVASAVLDGVEEELYLRNRAVEQQGSLLAHRGETLLDLDRSNEARDALAEALVVLRETRAANPEWQQTRIDEARVLVQLARLAEFNGSLEYANQALRQAREVIEGQDDVPAVFEQRAEILRALAMSERNFGRGEEALELMRQSLATWQELTRRQPDVLAHRLSHAIALWDAGALSEQYQQLDEAIGLTRQAVKMVEDLAAESDIGPGLFRQARFALGEFRLDLAYLLGQRDGTEGEVRELLTRSVVVLENLVSDYPEDIDARDILGVARERLAD